MQPIHVVRKGRGAVGNPEHRFRSDARERADDGWPGDDPEPDCGPATQVTTEQARSIVSRNQSPDIGFEASINPYRGCEHGCVYCYARPGHAYLGLSPGLDFETRLVAKVNAAELLAEALARPGYRPDPIAIGTVTDAWQPIERRLGITRACVAVLSERRHPFSFVTKGSLVERDLDLIAPMARAGRVCAMVTLTTLDPELARALEPRAPAPWRRLQTIRRLADAGVPVGVSLAPVIPFVNEPEIESVLDAAHAAGAGHANAVVLRLPLELRDVFHDWLRAVLPERAERVIARLRDLRGGRDNDPRFGSRMTGEGPFAAMLHARFALRVRRLGLQRRGPALDASGFVAPPPPAPARTRPRPPAAPSPGAPRVGETAPPACETRASAADPQPRQRTLF